MQTKRWSNEAKALARRKEVNFSNTLSVFAKDDLLIDNPEFGVDYSLGNAKRAFRSR